MSVIAEIPLNTETENNYNLPQEYLDKLYLLMKTMSKYFKDNKIKYFAEGGTLLGIVRDGGQIPYDNDIDIGVFESDFIKIMKLKDDIEKKFDFAVQYDNYMLKIFAKGVALEPSPGEIIHPCIDIFIYEKWNHQVRLKYYANQWPNAKFTTKDFEPLIYRKYHDVDVLTPKNPTLYLNGVYGDWKTKVYTYKKYLEKNG